MKIAELRAKGKDELKDLVLNLKKEQFNLRFQEATGELANQSRFKEVRKTIARAMTLINAPEGAPAPVKKEKKAAAPKKAPAKKAKAKKE